MKNIKYSSSLYLFLLIQGVGPIISYFVLYFTKYKYPAYSQKKINLVFLLTGIALFPLYFWYQYLVAYSSLRIWVLGVVWAAVFWGILSISFIISLHLVSRD